MDTGITLLLCFILLFGYFRKVDLYDSFVTGAAQGIKSGLSLIPYLLAILFPVYLWQGLGLTGALCDKLAPWLAFIGLPGEVLPLMIMRPLSGSASLGILTDIFSRQGPDSPAGLLASIYQGGTDTTFFVLTVYCGSVGVKNYRHTLKACLTADLVVYGAGLFWLALLLK
ncbi:MAG: spore maturation protein [Clostridiales bacterium]